MEKSIDYPSSRRDAVEKGRGNGMTTFWQAMTEIVARGVEQFALRAYFYSKCFGICGIICTLVATYSALAWRRLKDANDDVACIILTVFVISVVLAMVFFVEAIDNYGYYLAPIPSLLGR